MRATLMVTFLYALNCCEFVASLFFDRMTAGGGDAAIFSEATITAYPTTANSTFPEKLIIPPPTIVKRSSSLLSQTVPEIIQGGGFVSPRLANTRELLFQHLTQPANREHNIDTLPSLVMVKLIPIKIQDLNEKSEVLETTLRLQLTWQDSRLAWDPSFFDNTTQLIIPGDLLWGPDVAILNSVSDVYHVVRDRRFEMKVESDGRIWWQPTGIVKTYCKLNLRYFPFDKQNCAIILESPTLDIRFMNLTLRSRSKPVDMTLYVGGETWDLIGVSGTSYLNRVTTRTFFARVEFFIHLQRSKIYHILNVILPALFLSFVQIMFFLLPATHPQRVGSSTTTLLSVVVFQSVAASQLPKTSTDIPLLAIYIFIVTFISGLSVCTSIFVAKMVIYADQKKPIPKWLRRIPKFKVNLVIFKKKQKQPTPAQSLQGVFCIVEEKVEKKPEEIDEGVALEPAVPTQGNHRSMFNSWSDISEVFDKFLFLMAVATAISSPILLFLVIPSLVDE